MSESRKQLLSKMYLLSQGIHFDDEEGQWITTENGHKVHLNEAGEPDKGNPHVIGAMEKGESGGTKTKGKRSSGNSKSLKSREWHPSQEQIARAIKWGAPSDDAEARIPAPVILRDNTVTAGDRIRYGENTKKLAALEGKGSKDSPEAKELQKQIKLYEERKKGAINIQTRNYNGNFEKALSENCTERGDTIRFTDSEKNVHRFVHMGNGQFNRLHIRNSIAPEETYNTKELSRMIRQAVGKTSTPVIELQRAKLDVPSVLRKNNGWD